jgi:asparagine synthase (glutamine-hydrolysing)
MSGIAGIAGAGRHSDVQRMLNRIAHRGGGGQAVFEIDGVTLGVVRTRTQAARPAKTSAPVHDYVGDGHYAEARIIDRQLHLARDPLGVSPLYYGWANDGALCFASEVKAMLEITRDIRELPPGHRFDGETADAHALVQEQPPLDDPPLVMAKALRGRLETAVQKCICEAAAGAWLSGGLDSSTMAALARPHVSKLCTFAAGMRGAPDLEYARQVARHLQSEHREVVVTLDQMLAVLPKVIYHLESFDALLVRSSITNYLVAKLAAEHVPEVFSGEGGDELFAGYEYLKSLPQEQLPAELVDITSRLHNTALQRVDRSASAHGLVAHVAFLDPEVVDYALRIPAELKIRDGVEKWILRRAMDGLLPESVLNRRKAKFWEGAGVGDLMAQHADERIGDDEFCRERRLPNGWTLNAKEELMYYRIFRDHFGDFADLSWMGRTKGAPSVAVS